MLTIADFAHFSIDFTRNRFPFRLLTFMKVTHFAHHPSRAYSPSHNCLCHTCCRKSAIILNGALEFRRTRPTDYMPNTEANILHSLSRTFGTADARSNRNRAAKITAIPVDRLNIQPEPNIPHGCCYLPNQLKWVIRSVPCMQRITSVSTSKIVCVVRVCDCLLRRLLSS